MWTHIAGITVQIALLALTYHWTIGHRTRLREQQSRLDSLEGKVANIKQTARRTARSEVEEALDDPAMQREPQDGGGSSMQDMMMAMLMQGGMGGMMGGQQQEPEGDETSPQSGHVLGDGGSHSRSQ